MHTYLQSLSHPQTHSWSSTWYNSHTKCDLYIHRTYICNNINLWHTHNNYIKSVTQMNHKPLSLIWWSISDETRQKMRKTLTAICNITRLSCRKKETSYPVKIYLTCPQILRHNISVTFNTHLHFTALSMYVNQSEQWKSLGTSSSCSCCIQVAYIPRQWIHVQSQTNLSCTCNHTANDGYCTDAFRAKLSM